MSVHLDKYKVSYFAVPKCACTSLKTVLFSIENGFPFRPYLVNGVRKHIHNIGYASHQLSSAPLDRIADHWKFTVVREPVSRILSCFTNRVVHHGELNNLPLKEEDRERGVVEAPDWDTFVAHLPRYRELSASIRHHSEPISHFLGNDPSFFDHIYRLDQISELEKALSERVNTDVKVPKLQTGGAKVKVSDVSQASVDAVKSLYHEDFEIFGGHF